MSRFFFSLQCGQQCFPDPDGVLLADAAEARQEAILIAGDLLGPRSLKSEARWSGWTISVREEAGEAFLDLSLIEAASVASSPTDVDRSNVIDLPRARLPQSFTAAAVREIHNEVYSHFLAFSVLKAQNRYVRAMLSHEVLAGREIMGHARELVARSRKQTHAFV